jgi:hypothetical protein
MEMRILRTGLTKRIQKEAHKDFMVAYKGSLKSATSYGGPAQTLWSPPQVASLLGIEPWKATAAARYIFIYDPKNFGVMGTVDKIFFVANAWPKLWALFKVRQNDLHGEDWLVRWTYDGQKNIHKRVWE